MKHRYPLTRLLFCLASAVAILPGCDGEPEALTETEAIAADDVETRRKQLTEEVVWQTMAPAEGPNDEVTRLFSRDNSLVGLGDLFDAASDAGILDVYVYRWPDGDINLSAVSPGIWGLSTTTADAALNWAGILFDCDGEESTALVYENPQLGIEAPTNLDAIADIFDEDWAFFVCEPTAIVGQRAGVEFLLPLDNDVRTVQVDVPTAGSPNNPSYLNAAFTGSPEGSQQGYYASCLFELGLSDRCSVGSYPQIGEPSAATHRYEYNCSEGWSELLPLDAGMEYRLDTDDMGDVFAALYVYKHRTSNCEVRIGVELENVADPGLPGFE